MVAQPHEPRRPRQLRTAREDTTSASALIRKRTGAVEAAVETRELRVVRTAAEAMVILDHEEWIGLDLETSGLSPWLDKIAVVTLYGEDSHTAAVIHVRGSLIASFHATFRAWLGNRRRKYVTHNGVCFDIPFLANAGVDVFGPEWFDTMIGEAVTLKVGRHDISRSLQDTLVRRLKKEINKSQQLSEWMAPELTEDQVGYCTGDVQHLPALRRKQLDEVEPDARAEAMEVEAQIIPAVLHMHHNGMPLHLPSVEAYLVEQREAAERAVETLTDYMPAVSNFNSVPQVLNAARLRFPEAHLKSTAAEGLQLIAEENEGDLGAWARALLVYRRSRKRQSMFSAEWRRSYAFDHRLNGTLLARFNIPHNHPDIVWVHSRFKQLGTDTGRFSSSDPNGQQIPKDARRLFGNVPGYKVVSCDYSQLEIRVAANVAEDAVLIKAFEEEQESGGDIHTMIAAQLFNKSADDVTKEERKLSKAATFTLLFGGGVTTLYEYARMSGSSITEMEAASVFRAFFDRFYGLRAMRNWASSMAKHSPVCAINLPHGLRRVLAGNELTSTRILNTMVQGSAAAGLKFALRLCVDRKLDRYLCATVHDELVGVVPERDAEQWGADIQRAMIDGMRMVLHRVPVRAELAIGNTWS